MRGRWPGLGDRHHQAAVAGHDLGKGRFVPLGQKPGNQFPIAGRAGRRLARVPFSRRLHSAMVVPGRDGIRARIREIFLRATKIPPPAVRVVVIANDGFQERDDFSLVNGHSVVPSPCLGD